MSSTQRHTVANKEKEPTPMSQVKFPVNPFQIGEIMIDQSVKAMHNLVKVAEQNEKAALQVIDFNRKNREEGVKLVELAGEQMKQTTRLFVDLFDKVLSFQMQSYKQASKASMDELNKQVAQFSKS
jgi:hypothetical protein